VQFLPAATGEKGDKGLGGIKAELCGVFLAGDAWRVSFGKRMADELRVDATLTVEAFLEGEDDEHLGDALLHPAQAAALPGPELWRDEPDDRNACAMKVLSETEVDVREVDEDGDIGPLLLNGFHQPAIVAKDARDVQQNFCNAHDGDIFGVDDALLADCLHLHAAEAGEDRAGDMLTKGGDDGGAVGVSGGFAC